MSAELAESHQVAAVLAWVMIVIATLGFLWFAAVGVLARWWRLAFTGFGVALLLQVLPAVVGALAMGDSPGVVFAAVPQFWANTFVRAWPVLAIFCGCAWVLRDLRATADRLIGDAVRRWGTRGGLWMVVFLLVAVVAVFAVTRVALAGPS